MLTTVLPKEGRPSMLEERRALVERVAASAELRRAARLRNFLLYVCDQALVHGATVIHEQQIGVAVFGRAEGYDTSIDNIVRVNATELRKRLEHYFRDEGRAEELTLELQRGGYAPTFSRRTITSDQTPGPPEQAPVEPDITPATPSLAAVTAVSVVPDDSQRSEPGLLAATPNVAIAETIAPKDRRTPSTMGWAVLCSVLFAGCMALAWQVHSLSQKLQPWTREPAMHAFWSDFFSYGEDTDILLADTSFALAEDMLHRQISLQDYLNYNYKHMAEDETLPETQRNDLARVLERNNGSIADFQVAAQLMAIETEQHRFTLSFARFYSPEAAKHHSLVLIGSQQSNPWVSLFADNMNFDLEYDPVQRRGYVVNRSPRAGEAKRYPAEDGGEAVGHGYAIIALMPDLSGKGRTLLVEGTDSQATGAAGDFITSEDSLAGLMKRLPVGTMPNFEVLLRTSQLNGTPMRGQIVAVRVYPAGKSK